MVYRPETNFTTSQIYLRRSWNWFQVDISNGLGARAFQVNPIHALRMDSKLRAMTNLCSSEQNAIHFREANVINKSCRAFPQMDYFNCY